MDKNQHRHHEGGGFMNGFLLGAIIGAAVVYFLFTEKGKKMLKTVTEEGIEGFGDIKDLIQEEMDEDEYEEEEVYEEPMHHDQVAHHVEPLHHHEHEEHEYHAHEEHEHPAPSKVKRFFKGVKR
jgi:hypothetical protein